MKKCLFLCLVIIVTFWCSGAVALSDSYKNNIFAPGVLKAIDSDGILKAGEIAPNFNLRSVAGDFISLEQFLGKKNVIISFIPAAWTPVCSDQWPGYNIVKDLFDKNDAILIGISVDNIPTLFAWTQQMGNLWFPVCSDFYPHGKVANSYGVLRSDGVAERAIFIINKKGIVHYAKVYDINKRPPLENIITELEKIK